METIQTNVIVIGGGPSGATAARELAQGGSEVVLLEKDLNFEKPCGGGLFLRAFEEFGIPLSLVTQQVDAIDIVAPDKSKVSVDIRHDPLGVVHRQVFDRTLRDLAQESGASLLHAKANTVSVHPDKVIVEARDKEGRRYRIEAEYLVAADGVHSLTRRRLLGETPHRVLTGYADLPDQKSTACQFWFGDDISPGHYAWIFPHYRGINMGLIADDQAKMQKFYERFFEKASLDETHPPKPKGYFIPYWKPMTLYRDRVFYVGDSASLVMPFTYEGIYYALKSGRLAARAILENRPESYAKNWNDLYLKKFRFLRLLQTIFLQNDWWVLKMSRLYRHPKFQRAVIGYWSGSRKPSGVFMTFYKVMKALISYK